MRIHLPASSGRRTDAGPTPPPQTPTVQSTTVSEPHPTGDAWPTGPAPAPALPGSEARPVADASEPAGRDVVRSTRTSRTWTAAVLFFLVLILLLVFVLQNGQDVEVSFLGADGTLPLAVAMLFAAVAGALLVAIPGVARIVQIRHGVRRQRRTEAAGSHPR